MSHSDASTEFRNVPRDRVTGVPATHRAGGRIRDGSESDYIQQEIRRTRASMGDTLDQIEDRLSPARIKRELKQTIDETIADVRDEYNPKRLAKRAGDTMLDTIKDHPLAAMAAGLSVGYLAMKGAEESRDGRSYERAPRRRAAYSEDYGNAAGYPRGPQYAEFSVASPNPEGMDVGPQRTRDRVDEVRDRADHLRDRMRDSSDDIRDRVENTAHDTVDRARELKDATVERSRGAVKQAGRGVRSAGSRLEDFLYENPLAAGAVAVGIGAIIGGFFPSTSIEDRYMGPARDQAFERARRVADETMEHGKEAASRIADEAKDAAKDVAEKGKKEAKSVQGTAQRSAAEEARNVQGTAQRSAAEEARNVQGTTWRSAAEEAKNVQETTRPRVAKEARHVHGTAERSATERRRDGDEEDPSFGSSVK